jgi:hypothetical protein
MPSIIALTGIHIDRAYPGLGKDAATRRRALSLSALVSVTRLVRERAADAIVLVGDLFDDSSVGPNSVASAMSVLDSAGVPILVAPGQSDPIVQGGPFAADPWPASVWIWQSPQWERGPDVAGCEVVGRARGGKWESVPSVPQAVSDGPRLIVTHGLAGEPPRATGHVVTTGPAEYADNDVTVLQPVVGALGDPFGRAALITVTEAGTVSTEWLALLEGDPSRVAIDVTAAETTDDLIRSVAMAMMTAAPWSVVELTGMVQPGVLLPPHFHIPQRDDVVVNDATLQFVTSDPPADDHTAVSEFIRSISSADADERTRHQAIAHGLRALHATTSEEVVA